MTEVVLDEERSPSWLVITFADHEQRLGPARLDFVEHMKEQLDADQPAGYVSSRIEEVAP